MKATFLTGLSVLVNFVLYAQFQTSSTPGTYSTIAIPGSSNSWNNAGNIASSDDQYADFGDINGGVGSYTDYLVATNFSFSIPMGATIHGIKVEIECSDSKLLTTDHSVRIVRYDTLTNAERANENIFPISDDWIVYGGPTDTWGEIWNDKLREDETFGIAISTKRNDAGGVMAGQVDNIKVTVYYGLTVLPVTLTHFAAVKEKNTVHIKWHTASETNMESFRIERSTDGSSFQLVTSVPGRNQANTSYQVFDTDPIIGISYYRLKMEGRGGYLKYSDIIPVLFTKDDAVTIYPSLWQQGTALNISNINREKLLVCFFNEGGQLLSNEITQSQSVPVKSLINRKGRISYKVYDNKKNCVGKGVLIIL